MSITRREFGQVIGSTVAAGPLRAGCTPGGLPVGLQIVGRHRGEWSLLQIAHAFEQTTRHGARRPPVLGP